MAVYMVTYDLRQPGRNYQPVYNYLATFPCSHGVESVWFIDSHHTSSHIRSNLQMLVDPNDIVVVARLARDIAAFGYPNYDAWFNHPGRNW